MLKVYPLWAFCLFLNKRSLSATPLPRTLSDILPDNEPSLTMLRDAMIGLCSQNLATTRDLSLLRSHFHNVLLALETTFFALSHNVDNKECSRLLKPLFNFDLCLVNDFLLTYYGQLHTNREGIKKLLAQLLAHSVMHPQETTLLVASIINSFFPGQFALGTEKEVKALNEKQRETLEDIVRLLLPLAPALVNNVLGLLYHLTPRYLRLKALFDPIARNADPEYDGGMTRSVFGIRFTPLDTSIDIEQLVIRFMPYNR